MKCFIFDSTHCSLFKMTSYCLNPNVFLNLSAAVVLQSIITLIANSFCRKNMLGCFLVHLLVYIYIFYGLKDILLLLLTNFYDLILLLYVLPQYSIILYYCFYAISFIRFPVYINHIHILYSTEGLGFLIYSFALLYSLNTLFTEANS